MRLARARASSAGRGPNPATSPGSDDPPSQLASGMVRLTEPTSLGSPGTGPEAANPAGTGPEAASPAGTGPGAASPAGNDPGAASPAGNDPGAACPAVAGHAGKA